MGSRLIRLLVPIALSTQAGEVIVARGATGQLTIAETGTGSGALSRIADGASISNGNHVVFGGQEITATGSRWGLFIGNAGDSPVPIMYSGDLINGSSVTMGVASTWGVYARALNDRGQVIYPVSIGTQTYLIRATATPGLLADRPLLPEADSSAGEFRFRCPVIILGRCYFDPPLATGYDYAVEGNHPFFASVLIPAALPAGDSQFSIEFSGGSEPLEAGRFLNFPVGGVGSFRITGIDSNEALDPSDPLAFVTGVTFVAPRAEGDSFTMVPIVDSTGDQDGDGVLDMMDNCPANANPNQLDSDGDGVGNVCDNCPDAANPGQADADGNGVGDVCEVIAMDTTPPVITPNVTGTLGANGWYTSSVGVSWTVIDLESMISSQTGCGVANVNNDTSGETFTCSATSEGGTNTASVTIKRDATAPTASATASPGPNGSGWHNGSVTVSFAGNDATSGIASCSVNTVLSGDGAGQSASGSCADNAGNNSATATASGINIDKTAPVFSGLPGSLSVKTSDPNGAVVSWPAPSANGAISGIVGGVVRTPASGPTFPLGVTAVSCRAADAAGNTATAGFNVTVEEEASPPTSGTVCSVLGDARFLDLDLFSFTASAGESVTVTLRADSAGTHTGTNATLALFGNWVLKADASALPNAVSTTLSRAGTYYVTVGEQLRGAKFRGAYCVSLESSQGAAQSFGAY